MSLPARILVLLPVHNGQDRLVRQIESILEQDDVNVSLLVTDFASTDATFRILEEYAEEDSRVRIVYNPSDNGPTANLAELLYSTPADEYDFFAIARQGDIWHFDKLQAAVAHITANTSRPELYYSDVDLAEAPGLLNRNALRKFEARVSYPLSLLVSPNWAWSCTMVMNGALVKLLQRSRTYEFGRSFDTWIHAVALYCSGFAYCDLRRSLLSHCPSDEELAELKMSHDWPLLDDEEVSSAITEMAQALLREYECEMDPSVAKTVEAVATRHASSSARRYLFKCDDIALPSSLATTKLRWALLLGKL